jgi:hypothetical protein|tara:strand:+ start:644 stop:1078 length:435 start_codon:yes stop_codon:yes gene_type:complete
MALYKALTTDAGSTLNYWDYGKIEFNTSSPLHADQSANVNFWGYHDVDYYNDKKPAIDKYKSYSCNYVSGTDHYPYGSLTGVSGVVTGTQRLGPALPANWSWTANSVSGWMASSSDIRNGAEAWALVCVPEFSGATVTGQAYPD